MILLADLLDLKKLQKHIDDGMVACKRHPFLPLGIYNYTVKAQYTPNIWGDDVIDYCRGLIVHTETGEIIARPFKKFHNLNTTSIPETHVDNIAAKMVNVAPVVTEKMDGSLGILWRYDEHWGIATRGSFVSEQAKWASTWLKLKVALGDITLFGAKEFTPLFEIIYSENQIVVKYDWSGLVLIAMVNKHLGYEMNIETLKNLGQEHGFTGNHIVKDYGKKPLNRSFESNLPADEKNREGYVLTFDDGEHNGTPLKVKVKFDEYVKIHKLITHLSPKTIWELLSQGAEIEITGLPEHFERWAQNWVDKLVRDYNAIYEEAKKIYDERPAQPYVCRMPHDRKAYALYVRERTADRPWVQAVCFLLYDDSPKEQISELIWDSVKPRGDDKSFRTDGE